MAICRIISPNLLRESGASVIDSTFDVSGMPPENLINSPYLWKKARSASGGADQYITFDFGRLSTFQAVALLGSNIPEFPSVLRFAVTCRDKACYFDGTADYLTVDHATSISPEGGATFFAICRIVSLSETVRLLFKEDSYHLSVTSTGYIRFSVNSSSAVASVTATAGQLTLGEDYEIAGRFIGTTNRLEIWLNRELIAWANNSTEYNCDKSGVIPDQIKQSTNPLRIGSPGSAVFLHGLIYSSGVAKNSYADSDTPSNFGGYWDFNELNGSGLVTDMTSYGNDLTPVNINASSFKSSWDYVDWTDLEWSESKIIKFLASPITQRVLRFEIDASAQFDLGAVVAGQYWQSPFHGYTKLTRTSLNYPEYDCDTEIFQFPMAMLDQWDSESLFNIVRKHRQMDQPGPYHHGSEPVLNCLDAEEDIPNGGLDRWSIYGVFIGDPTTEMSNLSRDNIDLTIEGCR